MTLDEQTIAEARRARRGGGARIVREITKITDDYPDMDWDDAYAIQDRRSAQRKLARGTRIAGLKMGPHLHARR